MIESKIRIPKYTSDAFDNVEYQLRITYTLETDRRIMSFVDSMWGIEVTGGVDQFEPLTIVNVTPTGLARRAALDLTFNEALELFRKTGRYVRVYVRGDVDDEGEEDWTCDFWFKPRRPWRRDFKPIQWEFPWNDRRKPIYRESNCLWCLRAWRKRFVNVVLLLLLSRRKEEAAPHTRSLTPTPRPKNQPGENLLNTLLRPRGPPTKRLNCHLSQLKNNNKHHY
ncbi:hypothetical protein DOY81_013397 [Sarcophaga bullata]|nr:hypothetical protein DOY81_013397 [Sarcophaga bullata]